MEGVTLLVCTEVPVVYRVDAVVMSVDPLVLNR